MKSSVDNTVIVKKQAPILVLGYGNSIRRDDGAGPELAKRIRTADLPDVEVMTFHQLTPELMHDLAEVSLAVFCDAYPAARGSSVCFKCIEPAAVTSEGPFNHACNPSRLLQWTQKIYGRSPKAWMLEIPAHDFGFGEGLSPETKRAVDHAADDVLSFLAET